MHTKDKDAAAAAVRDTLTADGGWGGTAAASEERMGAMACCRCSAALQLAGHWPGSAPVARVASGAPPPAIATPAAVAATLFCHPLLR